MVDDKMNQGFQGHRVSRILTSLLSMDMYKRHKLLHIKLCIMRLCVDSKILSQQVKNELTSHRHSWIWVSYFGWMTAGGMRCLQKKHISISLILVVFHGQKLAPNCEKIPSWTECFSDFFSFFEILHVFSKCSRGPFPLIFDDCTFLTTFLNGFAPFPGFLKFF